MSASPRSKGPWRLERDGWCVQRWHVDVLIASTLIKVLLIPAYHSTDFEVHRHWLALTHSLPISQWYFDETSPWTLDYPPFFAYFSWILSLPAKWIDPKIVDLREGLGYVGGWCKAYMRVSVIVSELVLASALWALSKQANEERETDEPKLTLTGVDGEKASEQVLRATENADREARRSQTIPPIIASSILLHPGLVIVDHIHFQYNGFLFGILLWSIWAARERRPLLCALLFSSLLNFKHIYIYVAPAYFVYLLQSYVLPPAKMDAPSLSGAGERLFALATITLLPFAASIVPLLVSGLSTGAPTGPYGILKQMVSRLFPFSRGLNHAYWAANAWTLYTFADRALLKVFGNSFSAGSSAGVGSASRGLIGDTYFEVLPQISAGHCFLLTLLITLVFSIKLWQRPTYDCFVQAIALFGLTSFLFGFHVHEKAILLPLLPLTLLSARNYRFARTTLLLSTSGVYALFPLLYEWRESPIKVIYTLLWHIIFFSGLARLVYRPVPSNLSFFVHVAENAYLFGFMALHVIVSIIHPLLSASMALDASQKDEEETASRLAAASLSSSISSAASVSSVAAAVAASASATASLASSLASLAQSPSATSSVEVFQGEAGNSGLLPTAASDMSSFSSISAQAASSSSKASQSLSSLLSKAAVSSATASTSSTSPSQGEDTGAMTSALAMGALGGAQKLFSVFSSSTKTPDIPASNLGEGASTFEFLPLMMTSVYCALGIIWSWFVLGWSYLSTSGEERMFDPTVKERSVRSSSPTVEEAKLSQPSPRKSRGVKG